MRTSHIVKSGLALAFASVVGFGCNGERPATDPVDDTSTSEAIVGQDEGAANLAEPRPAPIGDTAVTGEQADQFGDLPSNVDTAARRMHQQDIRRQKQENPNQRPDIEAPTNSDISQ